MGIAVGIALVPIVIWAGLLIVWGQFWRTDQRLPLETDPLKDWPTVCAVIPARNEADVLPISLSSLLAQDYPGEFKIILVDDQSTDGTAAIAEQTAAQMGKPSQLQVLPGKPLPPSWTGKLWAMEQGTQQAQAFNPDYILLTDADIQHDSLNLRRLVSQAEAQQLDLVSIMVKLRCQSIWEKLLIPAFVFFFQQLYPFRWVNNPNSRMAAAAGGCILLHANALTRIGGLQVLRNALIDDCSLAAAVKATRFDAPKTPIERRHGGIWLGLSNETISLRPYDTLQTIWDMVARTAFTQLHYSPLLLAGTLVGMVLVYLLAPLSAVVGFSTGNLDVAIAGLIGWGLMTISYWPMVRFYNCPIGFATLLPLIGLLYTGMTLDSALRHWRGQGGAWKGRVYPAAGGE